MAPQEATPRNGGPSEHRTVSRVMGIIEAVSASEPNGLRLSDLADALTTPKSTVHGLAKGLVAIGYLLEQEGRYVMGPAVAQLITANTGRHQRAVAHQLRILRDKWNETAMHGILVGDSVLYDQSAESAQTLRAAVELHIRHPLWPTSSGKVLLASMTEARRTKALERLGVTPSDRDAIHAELAGITRQGFAFNNGGTEVGMFGVAAPLRLHDGPVTETIVVSGPESRIGDHMDELAADVRRAALALSHR